MYTNHKGWKLKNVHIEIELIEEESNTIFNRQLQFEGNLNKEQGGVLLTVANTCPVHKILTHL